MNVFISADVTTIAGATVGDVDGFGMAARFNKPTQIVKDLNGAVWIVDNGNNQIRIMRPSGLITTIAGAGVGYDILLMKFVLSIDESVSLNILAIFSWTDLALQIHGWIWHGRQVCLTKWNCS